MRVPPTLASKDAINKERLSMLTLKLTKTFSTFNQLPRRMCGINTWFTPRTFKENVTEVKTFVFDDTNLLIGNYRVNIARALYEFEDNDVLCCTERVLDGKEIKSGDTQKIKCKIEIIEGDISCLPSTYREFVESRLNNN